MPTRPGGRTPWAGLCASVLVNAGAAWLCARLPRRAPSGSCGSGEKHGLRPEQRPDWRHQRDRGDCSGAAAGCWGVGAAEHSCPHAPQPAGAGAAARPRPRNHPCRYGRAGAWGWADLTRNTARAGLAHDGCTSLDNLFEQQRLTHSVYRHELAKRSSVSSALQDPYRACASTCIMSRLCHTQDSTLLFEVLPVDVMDFVMERVCQVQRALLNKHTGYESATEVGEMGAKLMRAYGREFLASL
jgi:hypothetical protein